MVPPMLDFTLSPELGDLVARVRGYVEEDALPAEAEIADAADVLASWHVVERLRDLPNVRVAIATGGWQPTALLKLAHVGIGVEQLGFASSSDARARTEIMQLAAERAMQGKAHLRATYFGDGAWDRRASAALSRAVRRAREASAPRAGA